MRKKLLMLLLIFCTVLINAPCPAAEDEYDPQHTMLALNMAIVSIHKIVTTQDRVVLEQEYNNIINNLSLGNIENDYDLTALYQDMLSIITKKKLREEEAKIFQARYDRREQNILMNALSNVRAYGGNFLSWLGSLAVSSISSYFTYQDSKTELLEGLNGELWQLQKEDIIDCNELQERLLNSSWNLLRQYKLPDNFRLVQKNMDDFYRAVNEKEPRRKFRMLRVLEKDFQVYPPYWYYRARAAQAINDDKEAHSCFEKFNEIWRPVLRQDPYRVEAAKFRITELTKSGKPTDDEKREALELLTVIRENVPRDDWANNIFAGVAYFSLGEEDEGTDIVETNVDFGYGVDVSNIVLGQLREGGIKSSSISEEMKKLNIQNMITDAKDSETAAFLATMFSGNEKVVEEALTKLMQKDPDSIRNSVVWDILWLMIRCSSPSMEAYHTLENISFRRFLLYDDEHYKDILPIVEYYTEQGNEIAKFFYATMFYNGRGVEENKQRALELMLSLKDEHFYVDYLIGSCYNGNGDDKNAEKYYLKSAETGFAWAQDSMGDLYCYGLLGYYDPKALEWYTKAAEQGLSDATTKVGNMCEYGMEDNYKAYVWYYLNYLLTGSRHENMDKLDSHHGFLLLDDPILSNSEVNRARSEASNKYNEIKKRNKWD